MTGALESKPLEPPPDPYGRAPATSATLLGQGGEYSIQPGIEVRVGRDSAQCAVALTEPRVSGVHSTLRFDQAQLWVRDEQSNNGTYIGGERIPPNAWTVVPAGRPLRFGPVEFDVRLES